MSLSSGICETSPPEEHHAGSRSKSQTLPGMDLCACVSEGERENNSNDLSADKVLSIENSIFK